MLKIIGISIGLFISCLLQAQPAVTQSTEYRQLNLWLSGTNPAGLIFNPAQSFSIAKGQYSYTQGDFRKMTTAPNIHSYLFGAESYRQLKKLQLYGHISYSTDYHQEQQWNATVQPENHLFRFGDTIAGRQRCETYSLGGKIAIPLNSHWTIGGTLDYATRSNSKNTDPRNKNIQTDLLFSPGVVFSTPLFHLGANLIYHRIIEKISYSLVNDQTMDASTFYPLWFYRNEDFHQGINSSRNYEEERYGGALQASFRKRTFSWFNEFRYTQGTEILRIFPTQDKKTGETQRKEFHYTGEIRLENTLQHTIKPSCSYLERTAFEYLQTKGGNNTVIYETYGQVKRAAILNWQTGLSYRITRKKENLPYLWSFTTHIGYHREKTLFFVYPLSLEQLTNRFSFREKYERYFRIRKDLLCLTLKINYTTGHGTLPVPVNESSSPLPEVKLSQRQDLLLRDFRFLTAESLTPELELRYIHPIQEKYALSFSAEARYTQVLSPSCKQMNRQHYQLSAGFIF